MSAHAPLVTTPTGIRIGIAHQPPRPTAADRDALRIQDALLQPRTAAPMTFIQRLAGAIWRWL